DHQAPFLVQGTMDKCNGGGIAAIGTDVDSVAISPSSVIAKSILFNSQVFEDDLVFLLLDFSSSLNLAFEIFTFTRRHSLHVGHQPMASAVLDLRKKGLYPYNLIFGSDYCFYISGTILDKTTAISSYTTQHQIDVLEVWSDSFEITQDVNTVMERLIHIWIWKHGLLKAKKQELKPNS
ncbi:hypothetical protein STEG23_013885, partial [Scotinomys teguina]